MLAKISAFGLLALSACAALQEVAPGLDPVPVPVAKPHMPAPGPETAGTPPLVIIEFETRDVAFEDRLYEALSAALAAKPDAQFYVVAIAPPQSDAAALQRAQKESAANAARVVQAMAKMGLPASRITVAATTNAIASVSEVRIFVR